MTIQNLVDSVEGGPATTPADLVCEVGGLTVTPDFVLDPGESATCTFGGSATGNAGFSLSDTFTASGVDDEDTPVQDSGSETVPITDVLPTMVVTKTGSPIPSPSRVAGGVHRRGREHFARIHLRDQHRR